MEDKTLRNQYGEEVKVEGFNQEAMDSMYNIAFEEGYKGSQADFFTLLCDNEEALETMYGLAQEEGYGGTKDELSLLLGVTTAQEEVKKKQSREDLGYGPLSEEDSSLLSLESEFTQADPNFSVERSSEFAELFEKKKKVNASKELYERLNEDFKKINPDSSDQPIEYMGMEGIEDSPTSEDLKSDPEGSIKKVREYSKELAKQHRDGIKPATPQAKVMGTLLNSVGQILTVDDRAKYLAGVIMSDYDMIDESAKELESYERVRMRVGDFTDYKEGDFEKDPMLAAQNFGAAVIDGFAGFATSALISRATFGLGLATDMMGGSLRDYNKEKSQHLGITERELYESGQADMLVPMTLGAVSFALEKTGIDKALKGVSFLGKTFLGKLFSSQVIEGGTEYTQAVIDQVNVKVAENKAKGYAANYDMESTIGKAWTSKESLESLYKGIAGGTGARFTSTLKDAKLSAVIKTNEVAKIQKEALDRALDLEATISNPQTSEGTRKAAKTAVDAEKSTIIEAQKQVEETKDKLNDNEAEELVRLRDQQVELSSQLWDVENDTSLSREQKDKIISGLRTDFKKNRDRVKEIQREAAKRKTSGKKSDAQESVQQDQDQDTKKGDQSYDLTDDAQTKTVEQKYTPDTEGDKFTVIDKAKKAQAAIGKLFDNLNIVLHETDESFVAQSGAKQTGRGAFNRKQNTIHINLNEADGTTVAHEAFHALFRNTVDSGKWSGATKAMFNAIAPELNPKLREQIEDFVSDYDSNVQNEEKLAELFGELADSNTQFTPTTRQILKKWVNKVSKAIGLNRIISDADIEALEVKELFNVLSRKVETGEEITKREASMLDPEVREKLRKGEDLEQGTYVGDTEIKQDIEERDEDIPLQLKERTFDVTEVQRGSIKELAGKRVFAMAADRAAVGKVVINGREYNMMGGPLYAYLKQGGWAFTDKGAATRVLNKAKSTDGVALIMLQGTEGILGNQNTYDIVVDQLRLAVKNGTVNETELVDFINGKLFAVNQTKDKKTGKTKDVDSKSKAFMDSKNRGPIKSLDEFDTVLRDATYDVRNPFIKSLLGGPTSANPEIKKKLGIDFTTKQLIEDTTDPAFLNLQYGDLVAAIEFDKDSEIIDTRESNEYETHPSYPFIIKGKPLMVFNNPVDVRQVFGDYVSTSGRELSKQTKPVGAYSAMKAQPTTEVQEDVSPEETLVLMQKSTPKKITQQQVDDALSKDKTSQRILAKNIQVKTGDKVGVRLNLNVFKNTGVPVQAIHQGTKGESYKKVNGVSGFWTGQVQNYAAAVTVKDAHFNTHQKSVYEVKNKIKNKFPLASVDGIYQDIPLDQQDFSGTEIRFNPMNTQLFEDMDGRPVRKAEEVTLLGTRVYARGKIEYFTEENKPKPYTPEDTTLQKKKSIDAVHEDSENFMKGLRKKSFGSLKPSKIATRIRELFLDRQASLKLILDDRIKNVLVTKAGASAYAQQLFKDAEKTIYGGLSKGQERLLNTMIMAERIISINKDRINRQVKAAKLIKEYGKTLTKKQAENVPDSDLKYYYDLVDGKYVIKDFKPYVIQPSKGQLVTAQTAVQDLEAMKNELSPEEYADLEKRTKAYFDVYKQQLKELYDSGRITREAYEYFRDINYSPIKVLERIIFDNASATKNGKDRIAKSYGITAQDIQALSNRNEHTLLMDSRWGLAMTMNAVQKKRFTNKLLGMIANAIDQDTKGNYTEEFTLDPKVAKKKGFVRLTYFKKGVPDSFYASPKMAEQIMDVRPDTKYLDLAAKWSGVNLLKALATQINPFFFYTNIPVDVANAAIFTKTYARKKVMQAKPAAIGKLSYDVLKNITKKAASDLKGKGKYEEIYTEYLRYGGGLDYLSMSGLDKVNPLSKSTYDKFVDVASYTGTMSEQVVRISVYQQAKNDMIAQYKKANGLNPKGQDLEDILFAAAAEARETIDFSQGGSLIKRIDKIFPYTNAIFQGLRRPIDFVMSNPISFLNGIAQASVMGGVGGYYLNNFLLEMFLSGDDEEKEQILKDLRDKTSKFERANYYLIIDPRNPRDKDGNVNYFRVRKLPTISPLVTLAEELMYSNALGREPDMKVVEQALINSTPFYLKDFSVPSIGGGFVDAMGQNPAYSAYMALNNNYDTFRKEDIYKDYFGKEINNYAKGLDDPTVEEFYKLLGRQMDVSPKQLKVGVEKVITNPKTNVYVAMLYSGAETVAQLKKGGADLEFFKKEGDKLMKNFEGRAYRQTSEYIGEINRLDGTDFDQKVKDINTEEYLAKRAMSAEVKRLISEGKTELDQSALEMIKDNFEKSSFKYYKTKYTRMVKNPNVPRSDFEIVYERNPKAQAIRLKQYHGAGMSKREYENLNRRFSKTTGKKLSKNTYKYYVRED